MADLVSLLSTTNDFSAATADGTPMLVDKDIYDANSPSDFYGSNGTYISSNGGGDGVYDFGTSKLALASTTGIIIGMYCFIVDDLGGSNETGWYRIDAIDPNVSITLNTAGATTIALAEDSTLVSHWIGGLSNSDTGTDLTANLDLLGTYAGDGTNNLDIKIHSSENIATTAQLTIDNVTGSTTTDVTISGTNSSFVEDGTIFKVLLTSAIAVGAVIEIDNTYITLRHVKAVGDGGTEKASLGINVTASAQGSVLYDCHVSGLESGFWFAQTRCRAILCTATNYRNYGFIAPVDDTVFVKCTASGGFRGFSVTKSSSSVFKCLVIDATIASFEVSRNTTLVGCITFDSVNGIVLGSGVWRPSIVEDCSFNCTGDAFNGAANSALHSINNHTAAAGDVTDGVISLVTDEGAITGDPKFNLIVKFTDLANAGTPTNVVTSSVGGFTAAMEGKELLIKSGTNFVGGPYIIETYTDTNTVTLATNPNIDPDTAASSGVGGYYDFRLQTDSTLRDAGSGAFSNIGTYDDTDTPAIASILSPDTFNDVVGTGSGGAGGSVNLLTGLLT